MFTFVHTADWQLGKPFNSFPADVAAVLSDARLTAIDRIAALARRTGARHVLVAGDMFDAPNVAGRLLRQPIDKIAGHEGLVWHLLPGNHDPVQPGSQWERLARSGPPANVHLHLAPVPVEIERGVWLLPAPVVTARRSEDPTQWMDAAAVPPHALRIALAHGAVRNFGEQDEGIIAPTRAATAGLDYLALGDWHGTVRIEPRTWYSGTPEPDRFVDNRSGQGLVVRIEGRGAPPSVETVPTGRFTWIRREALVETADDLDRLERDLLSLQREPDRLIVRLILTGLLPLEDAARMESWRSALASRLRHLDADMSAVRIATSRFDTSQLGAGSELQAAADWLAAIAADDTDPRQSLAEAALVRLLALSAQTEESVAA
jgi:DNA repair exonuclease SbcCD nuclease subunit